MSIVWAGAGRSVKPRRAAGQTATWRAYAAPGLEKLHETITLDKHFMIAGGIRESI